MELKGVYTVILGTKSLAYRNESNLEWLCQVSISRPEIQEALVDSG